MSLQRDLTGTIKIVAASETTLCMIAKVFQHEKNDHRAKGTTFLMQLTKFESPLSEL